MKPLKRELVYTNNVGDKRDRKEKILKKQIKKKMQILK